MPSLIDIYSLLIFVYLFGFTMLRAKRFHSSDFIFVVLIVILITSIFLFMSNDQSQKQQRQLVERAVYNSYVSALAQVKSNASLLYTLQYHNEAILPLIEKANNNINAPQVLASIKQSLYEKLHPLFRSSLQYFEHQQVYLSNGESLLTLQKFTEPSNKNNVDNTTLRKVLQSKEASFGLSLKNGRYLYSYFFPVFNRNNSFIAVVEIAMPLTAMKQILTATSEVKSQYLLAKRPLLSTQQKAKLYQETAFSDAFYIGINENKSNFALGQLSAANLAQLKQSLSLAEETKLMQLKRFSVNTRIAGQDGIAVFMPVHDTRGYAVGGVFTFSPMMKLYISQSDRYAITVILLLMLLLTLAYAIRKCMALSRLQLRYQCFLDGLPFPIFVKGFNNEYIVANKAFYRFFNLTRAQLLDKKQSAAIEPEALTMSIADINQAGGCIEVEPEKLKENDPSSYKIFYYANSQLSKEMIGYIGYIKDISDRKSLNQSLKSSVFDQTQFMDLLPLGVRIFNLQGRTTFVNKVLAQLSGHQVDDLLDTDCDALFTCLQCNKSVCPLLKTKNTEQVHRIETIKYTATGEARTYEVIQHPYYSTEKQIQGIIEITRDITVDKSLLDKNYELMLTDELTGLLNHRGIVSAGENYFRLSQRANKPFFALYIDVIGMTKANLDHGEAEGDQLLISFAKILTDTFRETDLVARIGGDEFVILMTDSEYHITDTGLFPRLDNNVKKFNSSSIRKSRLVIDTGIVEYKKENHTDLLSLINDAEQLVYEHSIKRTLG